MDDTDDLIGALLSEVAGILENAGVIAASIEALQDPAALARLEQDIGSAATLVKAVRVLEENGQWQARCG